jgi:hypothetical protein
MPRSPKLFLHLEEISEFFYKYIISPMLATYHTQLMLFYLLALTFAEHKLWK